jgi:hypothetical protein
MLGVGLSTSYFTDAGMGGRVVEGSGLEIPLAILRKSHNLA